MRLWRLAIFLLILWAALLPLQDRSYAGSIDESGSDQQDTRTPGVVPAAKTVAVQAGRLIDGVTKQARERVTIVIRGDRIDRIEIGFTTVDGADVIDLRSATVLPGLIDCHVHIQQSDASGRGIAGLVTNAPVESALRTVPAIKCLPDRGFTTVRDVGGSSNVNIAVKKAIDAGYIAGPRIWTSGKPISPTGGHYDPANGLIL